MVLPGSCAMAPPVSALRAQLNACGARSGDEGRGSGAACSAVGRSVCEGEGRARNRRGEGARAAALAGGHGLATTAGTGPALCCPVLPPFPTHARAHTHSPTLLTPTQLARAS
eukprot:1982429-Rhodomonas_salina.2